MENLTKENYFNELMEKYPAAMARFCTWIDEYKKRVEWNILFSWNYQVKNDPRGFAEGKGHPKFHDIPLAMQVGILAQFFQEDAAFDDRALMREFFTGKFEQLQKQLTNAKPQ